LTAEERRIFEIRKKRRAVDEAHRKKINANTAFIVPIESSRDKQRREMAEEWDNRPAPKEKFAPYTRKNKAILQKIDVLTCHNTAVHMEDKQWVNLEKEKKNIDTIRSDIERLGLEVKLRVIIDKPRTKHTFTIEQKKRICNKPNLPFETVDKQEFTQTSDDKGFIFIKDVFQLDEEENYKHIFTASSDIERNTSAGLITRHRGTLRSYIFHTKQTLNKVADKKPEKTFALETDDEDVKPIKIALNVLNLNVEKLHVEDEVYNEDVQASIKLFQTAYKPPKEQIHPYSIPLKIDGEVSDQTLMEMDEAIVNDVKFNDPQVVHFDGKTLSFIDRETGELHVCDGSGLHISGEQLCYKEEEKDSSLDGIDLSAYAVGTTGTMQATAQAYYETLSRKQKHVLAENFKRKISTPGKPEIFKTATVKAVANSALSDTASKHLGLLSVGIVAYDIYDDKEVRASHILSTVMVGVGFIPVVGWAISGTYFLADITTLTITGKGLGGYFDEEVNELFDRPVDKPLFKF
jgi:peptidoglycan hydrolase-like protein with peptidoglycan-binding domain